LTEEDSTTYQERMKRRLTAGTLPALLLAVAVAGCGGGGICDGCDSSSDCDEGSCLLFSDGEKRCANPGDVCSRFLPF
jgi:hypothetical protein